MLRLFQVNEGKFVDLEGELTPNSRVCDVCEGVRSEGGGGVVLMVADGRQMEQSELVAAYSAGMEGKPIFVFCQTYLSSPSPPSLPSLVRPRPDMERALAILNQKPYPGLFQKLPSLAKLLSDYSSELYNVYQSVREERELQIAGWTAVLRNCHRIISMYRKHREHFSRVVDNFQSSRPHYIKLVQSFPEQVKLLHQLPVPSISSSFSSSSPSSSSSLSLSTTTSLYEWISTHDEKNSLVDLCSECERALAQIEEKQLTSALDSSRSLLDSSCNLDHLAIPEREGEGGRGGGGKGGGEGEKAAELSQLQLRMMENIHSTAQRAMRSGDGGTVAALTVSHHKSLLLMREQSRQLEEVVRSEGERKRRVTQHIHQGLRVVTEVQMKINESNSLLVLLHETLKLARKRFEVLEQVCSCGEVLGDIVGEVERRQSFNQLFTERVVEVAEELRRVREDEKQKRHTFSSSSHRLHFLTSLFPQLSHRLPDATCRLGRVPDTSDTTDLSRIKRSLPPQLLRPTSIADSFSMLLSQSQTLVGSTPHTLTSSHPHLSPQPSTLTQDTVEVEQLLAEASQPELTPLDQRGESERERNTLQSGVKEMNEETEKQTLTEKQTVVGSDEAARKNENEQDMFSEGFSFVRKQSLTVGEKEEEFREKFRGLEVKLEALTAERDELLGKMEEEGRERRERESAQQRVVERLTQKLKESEVLSESLAEKVGELQGRERDLQREAGEGRERAEEREGEWEGERTRFAAREAELIHTAEQEETESEEKCEDLEKTVSHFQEQLKEAEEMVSRQNSEIEKSRAEFEAVRDSKRTEWMLWKGDSEEKGREIQTLNDRNEELQSENKQLHSNLSSRNDQPRLFSANVSDGSRSLGSGSGMPSERFHSDTSSHSNPSSSEQWARPGQLCQADVEKLKSENETLKSENDRMNAELTEARSSLDTERAKNEEKGKKFQSEMAELSQKCENLTRELTRAKQRCEHLQSQSERGRAELSTAVTKLTNENQQLLTQSRDQQLKMEKIDAEFENLAAEHRETMKQLSQLEAKLEESKAERERLKTERDEKVEELLRIRESVRETGEGRDICGECESRNREISELKIALEEREEELKRSNYRQKQAQKAFGSTKVQKEQLELKIAALEEERKREEVAEETNRGSSVKGEESDSGEPGEGWECDEGEGEGDTEEELKRLKTELAVERRNRSVVADELQKVAQERDRFVQRFMETERELRQQQQRMVVESAMTASSSSNEGAEVSSGGASRQPRKLCLTVSNLQEGDVAIFCEDQFSNYLAVCVDRKTYYLNHSCVAKFSGAWSERVKPPFEKKLLIGRITRRLHVEVRKEDNRLHVPVGTRLYKLEAVELNEDTPS